MNKHLLKIVSVGIIAGLISEAFLGMLFLIPPIKAILYNPSFPNSIYIRIAPLNNIPSALMGITILSIFHSYFFFILKHSIPGKDWISKGAFWGFVIWTMYWVFQEWFTYKTLIVEPILLNIFGLVLLLLGALLEGLIISYFLYHRHLRL